MFTFFGVIHIMRGPQVVEGLHSLGYPTYFLIIDGVANWLAVAALLIPGFPRVREWAYAGLVFLMIGAIWSHSVNHQPPFFQLVILALIVASYRLWHRTSGAPVPAS